MTKEEHENWYRENQYQWMSDSQYECFVMLCDLMEGAHHIGAEVKPCGSGIEVNIGHFGAATFDFSGLTKAVLMAHDRAIRFQISSSGPGLLKLQFHKRQREGELWQRHPTMEQARETLNL